MSTAILRTVPKIGLDFRKQDESKAIVKNGLYVMLAAVLFVALFLGWLAFSWRSDVTHDEKFSRFIKRPLVLKAQACVQYVADIHQVRFSQYRLDANCKKPDPAPDVRTVRTFARGDTIAFATAKSYYDLFVGTVFYLMGTTTLDGGQVIEFEYYASFDHSPAAWETVDEFRRRREKERASAEKF